MAAFELDHPDLGAVEFAYYVHVSVSRHMTAESITGHRQPETYQRQLEELASSRRPVQLRSPVDAHRVNGRALRPRSVGRDRY